jgi:hypothetical protein
VADPGGVAVMCCSIDHEEVPAAWTGTYDDGGYAQAGVAYCDECARLVKHHGWYVAVERLSPTTEVGESRG